MNACMASLTIWTLWGTNHPTFAPRSRAWRMSSIAPSRSDMSAARNGTSEDVHQRARHFNPDGADDDPLDPLLGLQHGLRLDGEHLPQKRDHEGQGTYRSDERLTDEDPAVENLLYRLDGVSGHRRRTSLLRCCRSEEHTSELQSRPH